MSFLCSLLFLLTFPEKKFSEKFPPLLSQVIFGWVILYIISFAMTIGPICWIYLTEIMTEKGMGIAVAINWFLVIIMSYLTSFFNLFGEDTPKNRQINFSIIFFAFSGFCMIGFFLIFMYIRETSTLLLHEIQVLYKNHQYNPMLQRSVSM